MGTATVGKKIEIATLQLEIANNIIWGDIMDFQIMGFREEDLRIYMPSHVNRAYLHFFPEYRPMSKGGRLNKLFGIEVVNGYENKIIVVPMDNILRDIKHKEVLIS